MIVLLYAQNMYMCHNFQLHFKRDISKDAIKCVPSNNKAEIITEVIIKFFVTQCMYLQEALAFQKQNKMLCQRRRRVFRIVYNVGGNV